MYYPVEKYLAKFTDVILTINKEDYNLAKNKFRNTQVEFIHGVGVLDNKFNVDNTNCNKKEELYIKFGEEFNLKKGDYVFLNIGELNNNKNQIMQIKAMKKLVLECSNAKLLIAGEGPLKKYYSKLIKKYELEENIMLIGYRKDIPRLLKHCSAVISTSQREGLPVNIIESMFCNKPIIATNIRGHVDLLDKEQLVALNDIDSLERKMKEYIANEKAETVYDCKNYKIENVLNEINQIYIKLGKESIDGEKV